MNKNGKTSRYTYNHAGDRIVKSHGDLEGVYINGAPQGITFHEHDDFTIYPASIISVNKNRFTKHYFIGSQRIASKLGSGRFNNVYGRNGSYITAGQQDYAERINQIEQQREEYYKELGIPPGVPTMKGAYGDPENTGVGYNSIITELGDHSVPKNWEQFVVKRGPGETPGPPIIWSDPQNPEDAQPGYGFIPDETTDEETFYYHSDHLGSTSYITDQDGNITQYTAYLPYGELLVDEHSSSEDLPYKFNGKELDEETGLYYYGARYLQPVASVWYGVDPLTEEYTEISGYVYCHANPICLLDPDGQGDYYAKNGKWQYTDKKSDGFAYVEDNRGSHTFNKQKYTKLPISNSVLNQYANTVAKESSGNKEESYAIANTIMNISQYKKKSIEKTMQTEGIYGYNDGGKSTKYNNNEKYGMEAVLNALTNGKDYSNGALRWDGFDLAAKGYNHVKARTCGIDITPECFEAFKKAWPDKLIYSYSGKKYKGFAENFNSGKHPATQGPNKNFVLYKSVAVYGRTIFWGPVKNNKFHGTY